jgi:protein-tyrosine kinase
MSRIHDALKKAAQERASLTVSTGAREGAQAGPSKAIVLTDDHAIGIRPPGGTARKVDVEGMSFEELVKRCPPVQWIPSSEVSVFEDGDPKKAGAERFRTLRSRLYQIAKTRPLKRILITSSLPAEGKTFVAANLARSIARQVERRVLLIDADLRASRLHLAFGAPAKPGLTDYLRGEKEECDVIQCGPSGNLCLIPAGSEVANPSELLLGDRIKKLLDFASPLFDFVILDSPPSIPVHDASMLADVCDGTLFVVRAGTTNHEIAERAAKEFLEKNALGVVLNGTAASSDYGRYYDSYYGRVDP